PTVLDVHGIRRKRIKACPLGRSFAQLLILPLISYQRTRMQFNVAFIASALLLIVPGALGAELVGYKGAGCTGDVVARTVDVIPRVCSDFPGGDRSAKSIKYSGVPNKPQFFTGAGCTGEAIKDDGSGCVTGPPGFNIGSVIFNL
ncbi:hypothetical protein BDZ89DRAFT_1215209, partial [Hymenopellis radicata]